MRVEGGEEWTPESVGCLGFLEGRELVSESPLTGKVALVTGAGKRIGRSVALRLASEGADVIVNYRNSKVEADEVVAQISAIGRHAIAIQADVAKQPEVLELFAAVEREL